MKDEELRKLQWASRRGMLELDVVLLPYLEHRSEHLSDDDIKLYHTFLEETDPDLYSWVMGFEEPKSQYQELVASIRQFIEQQIQ